MALAGGQYGGEEEEREGMVTAEDKVVVGHAANSFDVQGTMLHHASLCYIIVGAMALMITR